MVDGFLATKEKLALVADGIAALFFDKKDYAGSQVM